MQRRRDSRARRGGPPCSARPQSPGGSRPRPRGLRPLRPPHRTVGRHVALRPRFPRHMPGHQPYVPATQSPAELTARALVLGVLLGLIFSASSVYLALKIGLTVSSSIPIAVLSITIFRALGRTSILENNIVQTTGSASDS